MGDPVRVIHLDSFDRDLVVIEKNVENVFTARLRDGVYGGRGLSEEQALMDLSNILRGMSLKVKKEARK